MLRMIREVVGLAAFCATFVGAPPREDIAYVASGRVALVGLAGAADAPTLAEVFSGCAVRVLERRDGNVRVAVEGWVPESSLSKDPPWPLPSAKRPNDAKREEPPAPKPSNEPVADLAQAHHLDVKGAAKSNGGAVEYVVTADLRTSSGRPVVVAGSKQTGRLKIYTQRRVLGETIRGDVLLEKSLQFEDGKATVTILEQELAIPDKARALFLSARADLPGALAVHGVATDVAIAGR